MDVGSKIKAARLKKGYTQEELAAKVGVQKSAVAKWETGRVSEIKRSNLKSLADALNIRPTDLLGDVNTDPVETANELAEIYMDVELRKMIAEYKLLSSKKQEQVREYVHFLYGLD